MSNTSPNSSQQPAEDNNAFSLTQPEGYFPKDFNAKAWWDTEGKEGVEATLEELTVQKRLPDGWDKMGDQDVEKNLRMLSPQDRTNTSALAFKLFEGWESGISVEALTSDEQNALKMVLVQARGHIDSTKLDEAEATGVYSRELVQEMGPDMAVVLASSMKGRLDGMKGIYPHTEDETFVYQPRTQSEEQDNHWDADSEPAIFTEPGENSGREASVTAGSVAPPESDL